MIAIADEAAAAADLVRAKDSREPAVRIRGLERHVTAEDGPGVAALVRRPRTTSSAEIASSHLTLNVNLRSR